MNFDNLKSKISSESNDFQIPNSLSDLRKSQLPIDKVRASMKSEIITQLCFILVFFSVLFFVELYPLAFSVYVIMMTLASIITLMYLVRMMKFVKNTNKISGDSKSSILYFVHELKLTLEVYKTAVMGSSLLLPVPVTALFFGNTKTTSPDLFSRYFLFEGDIVTTIICISIIIIVGILFYFTTIWWAEKLYGKYITQLEDLLEALD
ncbi:hypothetical protein [Portibacter lacus]|uniref:Uncharacterized protein n=1 Tax=Portibacter lacus TaxID=1099794 RepID=A0AA37WCI3_9BACT|nr:hypothetical protein [Portibacter lacus]GLR16093.1 hypothetical protein GCM10007940_07080 [Portibacter lacus]